MTGRNVWWEITGYRKEVICNRGLTYKNGGINCGWKKVFDDMNKVIQDREEVIFDEQEVTFDREGHGLCHRLEVTCDNKEVTSGK